MMVSEIYLELTYLTKTLDIFFNNLNFLLENIKIKNNYWL